MARPDWLRTFLAIYRSGSVTEGARLRSLSQPAASQQLASLEHIVGARLFVRTSDGVEPTERGRSLYAEVASALDQLETVLDGLDAGRVDGGRAPLRIGASAEYFSALVPRLATSGLAVVAHFGSDDELFEGLERGDLDAAVTSRTPPRRAVAAAQIGEKRFMLVCSATLARQRFTNLAELGSWLATQHWVAYSLELPITRRFWQLHLGRSFSASLRLVAPDLRVVVEAVAAGAGCSLLPSFVCAGPIAEGRLRELYPVSELIEPEPWFLCFRVGDVTRPEIARLLESVTAPEQRLLERT